MDFTLIFSIPLIGCILFVVISLITISFTCHLVLKVLKQKFYSNSKNNIVQYTCIFQQRRRQQELSNENACFTKQDPEDLPPKYEDLFPDSTFTKIHIDTEEYI